MPLFLTRVQSCFLMVLAWVVFSACAKQELDPLEDAVIQIIDLQDDSKVKIIKTGDGIENRCKGCSGQGVAIHDKVMYRLYDTGICQTFDLSDIMNPVKLETFNLGSKMNSNHSNCVQSRVDENGDILLYVSGTKGKCFVERVQKSGSTLVQTITLPKMDLFDQSLNLNMICGDDGHLWMFGPGGDKLFFAKARMPLLSEGDITLTDNDIIDYWYEDGYVYSNDVSQGGMVYSNRLFFLFGRSGPKSHLVVYDTQTHMRVTDIDLSGTVKEEPEDCELIPEGILIVTNGGNNYYIVQFSDP